MVYGFAILLGMTGTATVIPTSALVEHFFGLRKMATLFGIIFFIHQIGGFISTWVGGILVTANSGYGAIWGADVVLAAIASAAVFCIREYKKN